MVRWASVLKLSAKANAQKVLRSLLEAALPEKWTLLISLKVPEVMPENVMPISLNDAGVAIIVKGLKMNTSGLEGHILKPGAR